MVAIETDEGLTGYGEGAPGVLITGENLEGTIAQIHMLAEKLKDTDPTDLEAVSYTHLYVYKRQLLSQRQILFFFCFVFFCDKME